MKDGLCFVISPIGDAGSEARKRSDQILTYVITPPASECGYQVIRADKIAEPGMITGQIIQHILDDHLLIADLTDRNPNVFYELALRHAIRKPFVQIIQEGQQIPFDVAGMRTISVDHHDLDSVERTKKEIADQIRFIENEPAKLVTPISMTLDLQSLRQSDNPEQRSLADVLSALSDLRSSLSDLQKRVELSSASSAVRDRFEEAVLANVTRFPISEIPRSGEAYQLYMRPGSGKTGGLEQLHLLQEMLARESTKSKKSAASSGESSESKKRKE